MRMFDEILDTLAATNNDAVVEAFARCLTPLLCKEGRGEVECRRLYPTQPPLTKGRKVKGAPPTKGRRQRQVRVSSPFMNNPGQVFHLALSLGSDYAPHGAAPFC